MKNSNLTQLDTDQIHKRKFDEESDADRVILVGGGNIDLKIDPSQITDAIKDGLRNIKLDHKDPIEKNIFIPKIETIEVPVILKEIEYKTIEVIKYIEIPKIVEIEKPIVIQEIKTIEIVKERDYPFVMKLSAVIQAICVIGLLLINLLKK